MSAMRKGAYQGDAMTGQQEALRKRAVELGVLSWSAPLGDVAELAKRVAIIDPAAAAPFLSDGPTAPANSQAARRGRPSSRRDSPKTAKRSRPEAKRRGVNKGLPDAGGGPHPAGKGKRWTRIFNADADKIMNSQAPELFAIAFAVWYALVREASYRRSMTFEASDSYLSKRLPGMRSRNTVRRATGLLHSLGMLESASRTIPGTKNREPLLRTLHPAGDMPGADGGATAQDGVEVQDDDSEPSFV